MDLDYAKRKRKWCIVLGAFGFTCYGAYSVYNLPSLVKKRQRVFKLFSALFSVAEVVCDSADAIGILSKDIKQFLASDSDQIPQSLKQLSKIAKSDEFSESLSRISRALAIGILRGYQHGNGNGSGDSDGLTGRVLDKMFSEAGSGFASAVVGSFAKNLVMTLYSEWERYNLNTEDSVSKLVGIVCDDKCKELIGDVVRLFVSTAVTVYLDKTMNINTYDELFDGLTNPKREARVRDMLVSLCNGAVETCVQTSYDVWSTNSKKNSKFGYEDGLNGVKKSREKNQESGGLVRKMRSSLGVRRNMKFVLDMTGVVTFESVRSFLEFLLEKLSECIKRSVDIVHQKVVDRGVEMMRYSSGKSCAVSSVCLTLCLNILNSPWILAPNY